MAVNEQRVNEVAAIMYKDAWAVATPVEKAGMRIQIFAVLSANDKYNKQNHIVETQMDPTMFDFMNESDGTS